MTSPPTTLTTRMMMPGDDVALHELHRAVHRAVELALAREGARGGRAPRAVDVPGAQLGVDRHLLAGHGVEREARPDLGDALGALRDHDELDDREDHEDDGADDVVAAHDELAERVDDLARVGLQQDEPRRRDVEREPEQRREQEQRRERRDLERLGHVERHEQQRHRRRDVRRERAGRAAASAAARSSSRRSRRHRPRGRGRRGARAPRAGPCAPLPSVVTFHVPISPRRRA